MLVKNITATNYAHGKAEMFGANFANAFLYDWHKLTPKIEIITTDPNLSPEVFDLPIITDFVDDTTYR